MALRFQVPRVRIAVVYGAILILSACKNNDAVLGVVQPTTAPSLSHDVQPILTRSCTLSGCHNSRDLAEGMSLEAGNLYNPVTGAVGVQSFEASGLKRIDPGFSASSYLVAKVEGRQQDVGGCCSRMPLLGNLLSGAEIQVIHDWIDQGAKDN